MMSKPAPDPAEELARLSASGDTAALTELIRCTQGDVWRFIAHLTDPWIADDLTQETYIRALRTIRRFEGRSSVRTWLLTIARRVVIDELRKSYRRPARAMPGDIDRAERPTETTGDFEEVVDVGLLLSELDDDRRIALVLTQILGMSYAEAAAVCRVPIGTIRSRVARARQDLIDRAGSD